MPHVLHPDVGARRKEEPVDRDKEEADHVAGQGDAYEEYWERLEFENFFFSSNILIQSNFTNPWYLKLS